MQLLYNRKLNEKPRFLKFFTPWELVTMIIIMAAVIGVLPSMFHYNQSLWDVLLVLAVFLVYILRFRLGRPEGYFVHWLQHFWTPKHFRPGHVSLPCPIYYPPVPPPTHQDLAEVELLLFEKGFVYTGPRECVTRDSLPEQLQEEIHQSLLAGHPTSLN